MMPPHAATMAPARPPQERVTPPVIALIAFLTLVDLFATQAILPGLAVAFAVSPAAMGLAVNASTLGMAIAGLGVALFSGRIPRRAGIVACLTILALPTALLSVAPTLAVFAVLRVVQGLLMATAFALCLAYLGEQCSMRASAGAFAAYVTGNVASNLFGRLLSATAADHLGVRPSFLVFAALNLAGALLVSFTLRRAMAEGERADLRAQLRVWGIHLRTPALAACFAIGFCILFAFIGTFTFVNFVLVRPPFGLAPMQLGLVYFVFLPALLSTPLAGRLVARLGTRAAFWAGLGAAGVGLGLLLLPALPAVLAGLVLVGAGTFLAQAIATGFVGRAATIDRGAATGLYLASYFGGGLAGTAALGWLYEMQGWPACVAGICAALALAAALGTRLRLA